MRNVGLSKVLPKAAAFGRPGNNLKMGIVGLPNIGKSYFFNALTNSEVPSENFPFCTIEPTEARAKVRDRRFDKLCAMIQPMKITPSHLSVIDIAGLVKGASKGNGLGNAFLANIKAVDAIYHVCRAFRDDTIEHVEGIVDPVRDLQLIHEELRIKDYEILSKQLDSRQKDVKRILPLTKNPKDRERLDEYHSIEKAMRYLEDDTDIKKGDWTAKEIEFLNQLYLLSAKPMIYLVNMSVNDYASQNNEFMPALNSWVSEKYPESCIIPFAGALEEELTLHETDTERQEYLDELSKLHGRRVVSALDNIIIAGYEALDLIYFFTCGKSEVRSWTIRAASTAPKAAAVIHSDFEQNFVIAEVMKFEDFVEHGDEAEVRASGKLKIQGKDYLVEDGDILNFKISSAKH